ncbi:MAG: hypothetical protein ACHQ1D_03450 [Nitrososphaerales archaeon]
MNLQCFTTVEALATKAAITAASTPTIVTISTVTCKNVFYYLILREVFAHTSKAIQG